MLTHYLKIALRSMRRFKLQTLVCLTGLAVGMTCFALGTLWLRFIESFEDFVPEADNICLVVNNNNFLDEGANYHNVPQVGESLRDNMPGIENCCFLMYFDNKRSSSRRQVTIDGKDGGEVMAAFADSGYVRMFGIEAEEGSLEHFNDGSVALTRSTAKRLFGDEKALGKTLTIGWKGCKEYYNTLTVTAIIADRPQNSQFRYDMLVCCEKAVFPNGRDSGSQQSVCSFVKVSPAFPDSLLCRPMEKEIEPFKVNFTLVPIKKLRTEYPTANVKISTQYVQWFMMLGLLVIACSLCNYIITMVSHLRRRGWEFSLRRVLGSSRVHIIYMVALETFITMLLSAALGYALTLLVLPEFREYSGIDIPLASITPRLFAYLSLVIAFAMFAAIATAWIVMSRTQRNILASRQLKHSSNTLDRCGVVLQMALSMAIIFAVTIILRQIDMIMYTDDLGFSHQNLVNVYHAPDRVVDFDQYPLIEEHLDSVEPMFPKNSLSDTEFADESGGTYKAEDGKIDSAYFDFYHMKLLAGRLPQKRESGREICVNESFCELVQTSPENIVGRTFCEKDYELAHYVVTGVLQNAHILGPTMKPAPTAYLAMNTVEHDAYHVLRVQPGRAQELIDTLKVQYPDMYFINVEQEFEQYVQSEQMLIKILMAVGGASLFVCVIGTFSLVSLSLEERRKEIAIRKVYGAKMRDILRLFLRGQVLSLIIAALIAYPVAYIIMRHWLEGYAKQAPIPWWLIPGTFLAISAVVIGTITLKIWRAAKESTVEALSV